MAGEILSWLLTFVQVDLCACWVLCFIFIFYFYLCKCPRRVPKHRKCCLTEQTNKTAGGIKTFSHRVCSLITVQQKEARPVAITTNSQFMTQVQLHRPYVAFFSLVWHRKCSSRPSKVCCRRVGAVNEWQITWVCLSCSSAEQFVAKRLFPQTPSAGDAKLNWEPAIWLKLRRDIRMDEKVKWGEQ